MGIALTIHPCEIGRVASGYGLLSRAALTNPQSVSFGILARPQRKLTPMEMFSAALDSGRNAWHRHGIWDKQYSRERKALTLSAPRGIHGANACQHVLGMRSPAGRMRLCICSDAL
jgi:hypothetical protein